jgi:hypothetical protein
MATASKQTNVTDTAGTTGQAEAGIGSPITNEAYNVLSALSSKLEGLEAYRKYSKDGDAALWHRLTSSELDGVQMLLDQLEKLVRDGKLRMVEPGRGKA